MRQRRVDDFRGRRFTRRTFYRYRRPLTYNSFPLEELDGSYNIQEGDTDHEEDDYDIFQEADDEYEEEEDTPEVDNTNYATGANTTPLPPRIHSQPSSHVITQADTPKVD